MAAKKENLEQLRSNPLQFLQTNEFQEMLDAYWAARALSATDEKAFHAMLRERNFEAVYPVLDSYLQAHGLSPSSPLADLAGAPEAGAMAARLLEIFSSTLESHLQTEYDLLGNSPATYFICGVWANMKRGREFHPASHGITVTYSKPDAYGNQNVSYRNKDYEMTLIFETVQEYTKNLSWTAHRLLVYTLIQGNSQNWRDNTASFTIRDYMDWAGLKSRDATYRQLKNDVQSFIGVKLTAESFKKYFESFYTTHLATEASITKYTGEVKITFAKNVREFLTQYYQLIPDWMGRLGENAYRMAFYLFYRARKDANAAEGSFSVSLKDIAGYMGLPTKEEVKNRNYEEAILKPFRRAAAEIEERSGGAFSMAFPCDSIASFQTGRMSIRVDGAMTEYLQKLNRIRISKRLEAEALQKSAPAKKRKKKAPPAEPLHETTSEP